MKNRIFFILLPLFFFLHPLIVSANSLCSKNGYTVLTINGIFTNENGAIENRNALVRSLPPTFKNQPIIVDYLYNPTHGKVIDFLDALNQKYFDQSWLDIQDSDFADMLSDMSAKVKTQKLLLVGHSQGNFYTNTIYDALADEPGGIPSKSLSTYGVATPASRVPGSGMYITSDTDKMIVSFVNSAPMTDTLPPNSHIVFQESDGDTIGHSFSKIYLTYEGRRIVSEVEYLLSNLKENDEKNSEGLCINPPTLTMTQRVQKVILSSSDFIIGNTNKALAFLTNSVKNTGLAVSNMFKNLSASVAESLPDDSSVLSTVLPEFQVEAAGQDESNPPTGLEENIGEGNMEKNNPVPPPDALSEETKSFVSGIVSGGEGGNPDTDIENISEENPQEETKVGDEESDNGGGGEDNSSGEEEKSLDENEETGPGQEESSSPDTTPPFITIIGDIIQTIQRNLQYIDAGATATDDVDGDVEVVTSGADLVDTSLAGRYEVVYSASDSAGNSTNATRTVIVDGGAMLNHPQFVFVKDNYSYIVSDSNALEIVDISSPPTLTHKGFLADNDIYALFAPKAVTVQGNYAYVVSYENALEIVDISNPILPMHKSVLRHGENGTSLLRPVAVTVSGNYAYVICSGGQNLEIVDISNPENPTHAGYYYSSFMSYPLSLALSSNAQYAYVTFGTGSGGMEVIDVSNPSAPKNTGIIFDGTDGASLLNPQSVFVKDNYAYITSRGDKTLEIVDISNSSTPTHKAKLSEGFSNFDNFTPNSIFVSGNYAYITSFVGETLEIVDISNPSSPIHVGSLANGENNAALSNPASVFVVENYAYVSSSGSNALEVVNVSNPSVPYNFGKIQDGEFTHSDTIVEPEPEIPPDEGPPDEELVPDTEVPEITSYTFNGVAGDISVNPLTDPILISLTASENVNWMSVKIEKEDDAGMYKIFQSGAGCVDGTDTCEKTWDGILSGGGLLQNGTYRLKVHIKDEAENEFYDYLMPYIIRVEIPS